MVYNLRSSKKPKVAKGKKISVPQELSAFERLPTEILQEIFFYSRNLKLPSASPCLYSSLTCDHVKKRFLCAAFAMDDIFRELIRTCPRAPCGEEREMGRFQGEIMSLKWFTYDFVSKCHKELLWIELKKTVDFFVAMFPESRSDRGKLISDLEVFLESAWSMSFTPLSDLAVDYSPDPDSQLPSLNVKAELDSLGVPNGASRYFYPPAVYITIKDHSDSDDLCRGDLCDGTHVKLENQVNLHTPTVGTKLVVPDRLLRSPWTEDKLRLLMWICDDFRDKSIFDEEPVSAVCDSEVASRGLEDAIREYCVPAMVTLARPSGAYWYREFIAEAEHLLGPRSSPTLDLGDKHFNFGIQINTDLLANGFMAFFNVPVEDKHLIAALEAAEAHGDIEAKVFRWLLPLAVLWEYEDSSCEPEFEFEEEKETFVLIKWALAKQAEELKRGIKDGFGSLAMKYLHEEQQQMKALVKEILAEGSGF
ncbi:hypothetical protein MMC10_006519 [Thelotrema lepadinum]|nr:hypothetical protein [Thelotrema lepadinum]